MLFNTLAFAKFFLFVFVVSWLLARWPKVRFGFLAVMSYVFYSGLDLFGGKFVETLGSGGGFVAAVKAGAPHLLFVPIVFIGSTVDFWLARWIAQQEGDTHEARRKRKLAVVTTVVMNTSLLLVFKYYNFVVVKILQQPSWHADIPLPIGISFFTFMSLSYVIDVYRREIPPSKNYVHYLTYICFFPHLVAGPIIRGKDLLPLFARPAALSSAQAGEGMFLIAQGIFKKVVISDYLALNLVDRVVQSPGFYTPLEVLMGIFGYAIQVYCDFSGYSDVAIGAALLLGYRFKINFDSPFKSANVAEFWRRWHISLSSWLRDYIYIPLGGSRSSPFHRFGKVGAFIGRYFNLWITMVICGIWHGAAWSFVVFGVVQGFAVVGTHLYYLVRGKKLGEGDDGLSVGKVLGVAATFVFIALSFVLIRTGNDPGGLDTAIALYRRVFSFADWKVFFQGLSAGQSLAAMAPNLHRTMLLVIAGGLVVQWFPAKVYASARDLFIRAPAVLQGALLFGVALILRQTASTEAVPFVYFQF
ncbi:MAG: MBOAT family O-acyltransferase [Polyangiaceae bacterium]